MTVDDSIIAGLPPGARVLVVRTSAIGDIVMCTPMAQAIKAQRPDLRLCWLVEDLYPDILDGVEAVDEIIRWPRRAWRDLWRAGRLFALWRAVAALSASLRRREFALAIDAQGLLRSRLLCRLSGAALRVGFASSEPGAFLLHRTVPKGGEVTEISSEYRAMAAFLGAPAPLPVPPFGISSEARRAAAELLAGRGVSGPYVVLCPFTTRPQKHWIDGHWAPLAAILDAQAGLPLVLLGGPADRARAAALALPQALDLVGGTSLAVAKALVAGAALVIGVDTGLTHVGMACGRPTVALFGSTRPYLQTGQPKQLVLYRDLECAPCRRRPSCAGRFDCMRELSPESVAGHALGLLAG